MRPGAFYKGGGHCDFIVWAPQKEKMALKIFSGDEKVHPMNLSEKGYWQLSLEDINPGDRYVFSSAGINDRPDPASFYQPEGVHCPSAVVDHSVFQWSDNGWEPITPRDMIIYEIHTGTFTEKGTLEAITEKLDYLIDLGVNTIELMPVAQFPGARNWGYDGVYPYAVQNTYGGPEALKYLVNSCHEKNIAVILDVVYNHLGPEGNYLGQFGAYFTDKYKTPWGSAVNFDDKYSPGVREYFIYNALYWFEVFHIDALRLDAVHGIFDFGAKHILEEIAEKKTELELSSGRKHYLIAESDLNDTRIIKDISAGGYGMDAQWLDDFHHAVRVLLTGEREGYYEDFGGIEPLFKALNEGFVHSWDYSSYRKKIFGSFSGDLSPSRFVAFVQNHDQVGNRLKGERLSSLADIETLKLAAGVLLLSPYIPMLFMGEEFAAASPFLYFVDHSDPQLINAVREGRKREFASFDWDEDPPDLESEETFNASILDWSQTGAPRQSTLTALYRELINIRKGFSHIAVTDRKKYNVKMSPQKDIIYMERTDGKNIVGIFMNFSAGEAEWCDETRTGCMLKIMDSSDKKWEGPGCLATEEVRAGDTVRLRPKSFVVYKKEK